MRQLLLLLVLFPVLSIAASRATHGRPHELANLQSWNQKVVHRHLTSEQLELSNEEWKSRLEAQYGIEPNDHILFYLNGEACNHTAKVQREVMRLCRFIGFSKKCMDTNEDGDVYRTFSMECEGTSCNVTWSAEKTLCALRETGVDFVPERDAVLQGAVMSASIRCGLPVDYYEVFSHRVPFWAVSQTEDDGRACALALSGGTTLDRQIICIDGRPRFLFLLEWGNLFAPVTGKYHCIFDNQCTFRVASTICYQKAPSNETEPAEEAEQTSGEEDDVDTIPQSDNSTDLRTQEVKTFADENKDRESTSNSIARRTVGHLVLVVIAIFLVMSN